VTQLMNSTLASMLMYYLPTREVQTQSLVEEHVKPRICESPKPEGVSVDSSDYLLATTELHQNHLGIMSYGCNINVTEEQSIGTQRLTRYGLPGPAITTLEKEGWINQESIDMVQDRFVAEMTQRIDLNPEDVDIPFLSRKLKTEIPMQDIAKDRKEKVNPFLVDEEDLLKSVRESSVQSTGKEKLYNLDEQDRSFRFDAVSLRDRPIPIVDEKVLVPSWGQYVRVALKAREFASLETAPFDTFRSFPKVPPRLVNAISASAEMESTVVDDNTIVESNAGVDVDISSSSAAVSAAEASDAEDTAAQSSGPPRTVVEQTIRWSTSSDIFFTPLAAEKSAPRRTLFSPRDVEDSEYLGEPPATQSISERSSIEAALIAAERRKSEEKRNLLEQRKRLMRKLRASGDDRL
jgi:hypothetical protein